MSEPNEMVHRVAEALRAACRKQFGTDWTYDVAWAFARAAIAEMREPTDAMKAVEGVHWDYSCQICGGLKEGWQAMIDEALKDQSNADK